VGAWRERMGTDEAKELYKDRAATAECVNALARQRGLLRLRVRGTGKVRGVLPAIPARVEQGQANPAEAAGEREQTENASRRRTTKV